MINFALIYCDVKCQIFFQHVSPTLFPGPLFLQGEGKERDPGMMLMFNCDDFSVCTTEQLSLLSLLALGYHAIMSFIHFSGHK